MENLPFYIYSTFGATMLFAIWLFYKSSHYSKPFLITLLAWLIIQSILGVAGFYSNPDTMTQRFPLLVLPPLLFMVFIFANKKGRSFIDNLDYQCLLFFI